MVINYWHFIGFPFNRGGVLLFAQGQELYSQPTRLTLYIVVSVLTFDSFCFRFLVAKRSPCVRRCDGCEMCYAGMMLTR